MMKGATVSARQPFSRDVGRRMGQELANKLGTKPHACWMFCEPGQWMEQLLAGIVETAGTQKLVGCTTDGEVSSEGFSSGSAVLGGLVADRVKFEVASASGLKANSESTGRNLARQFSSSVRHVQLLSDGLTGNGSAILRGMHAVLSPRVTISGGTAGDARRFQQTWQFLGNRVLTDSAVAISFSGEFKVGTGVRSGWLSAGAPKKVTRASGNVVYELDGEPALQVYRRYLGKLVDQVPFVGVQFPFGIVVDESLRLGEDPVLRAPMAISHEEGSVSFAGEIPEGATVVLTSGGTKANLLDASADAATRAMQDMRGGTAAMTFFYSCMARRMLLGKQTGDETERIRNVVGRGTPLIGFYTYGEFCPSVGGSECTLHNETATVTVIGV
ncbi:MAG: FIST N-terminal domain-containing protein [Thermodesulfobacteriota bacterium]